MSCIVFLRTQKYDAAQYHNGADDHRAGNLFFKDQGAEDDSPNDRRRFICRRNRQGDHFQYLLPDNRIDT